MIRYLCVSASAEAPVAADPSSLSADGLNTAGFVAVVNDSVTAGECTDDNPSSRKPGLNPIVNGSPL
jgi:hypothetical protein